MRKPIHGFPGYFIDPEGTVWKCLPGGGWKVHRPGKQVSGGYLLVNLRRDCKSFYRRVHRLVLEVFVGPCPEGMQACHADGNPLNNALTNLRWDTPQGNHADKRRHGRNNEGERNGIAILTDEKVRAMRKDYANGLSRRELSAKYHTVMGNVWLIVTGRAWKHLL